MYAALDLSGWGIVHTKPPNSWGQVPDPGSKSPLQSNYSPFIRQNAHISDAYLSARLLRCQADPAMWILIHSNYLQTVYNCHNNTESHPAQLI